MISPLSSMISYFKCSFWDLWLAFYVCRVEVVAWVSWRSLFFKDFSLFRVYKVCCIWVNFYLYWDFREFKLVYSESIECLAMSFLSNYFFNLYNSLYLTSVYLFLMRGNFIGFLIAHTLSIIFFFLLSISESKALLIYLIFDIIYEF